MPIFTGFDEPLENWSKLPHQFIEALPLVETLAEMKVILYILRHTWGYHDSEKKISASEFSSGRRRRNGTIDNGIGMNEQAVRDGLAKAEEHGFIAVEVDDSDAGRIKKYYSLRGMMITPQGDDDHPSESRQSSPCTPTIIPRSEKDTSRNKPEKGTTATAAPAARRSFAPSGHNVNVSPQPGSFDGDMSKAEPQVFVARYTRSRKQPETRVKCKWCQGMISDHVHDACPGCNCPVIWNSSFQADERQKRREKMARTQNAAQDRAWQAVQAVAMQFPAPKPLNAFKFLSAVKAMREQQDPDGARLVELAQRLANHKKSNGQTAEGFLAWLSNTYAVYGPHAYQSEETEALKAVTLTNHLEKDGHLWAVRSIDGVLDWGTAQQLT